MSAVRVLLLCIAVGSAPLPAWGLTLSAPINEFLGPGRQNSVIHGEFDFGQEVGVVSNRDVSFLIEGLLVDRSRSRVSFTIFLGTRATMVFHPTAVTIHPRRFSRLVHFRGAAAEEVRSGAGPARLLIGLQPGRNSPRRPVVVITKAMLMVEVPDNGDIGFIPESGSTALLTGQHPKRGVREGPHPGR